MERRLSRSPSDVAARSRLAFAYAVEFSRRSCRTSESGNDGCRLAAPLEELHALVTEHCVELLVAAPPPHVVQVLVDELLNLKDLQLYPLVARLAVEGLARHDECLQDFETKGALQERASMCHYETALHLYKTVGLLDEAQKVFDEAVCLERDGRSLIGWTNLRQTPSVFIQELRPVTPWWELSELPLAQILIDNASMIREEFQELLAKGGAWITNPAYPRLTDTGEWDVLRLYNSKQWDPATCALVPRTATLLQGALPGALAGLPYIHHNTEEVCFFRMSPGTRVLLHSGGCNARLNISLGLLGCKGSRIAVAGEEREWRVGQILVFDDSCDHAVWHDGDEDRWVLTIGVMHPDLIQKPWIFRDAGAYRTEYETFGPEVWTGKV